MALLVVVKPRDDTDAVNLTAPRWRIPVEDLTRYFPVGFALNPVHKEIMISSTGRSSNLHRPPSGIMNTVMTLSWPEIF